MFTVRLRPLIYSDSCRLYKNICDKVIGNIKLRPNSHHLCLRCSFFRSSCQKSVNLSVKSNTQTHRFVSQVPRPKEPKRYQITWKSIGISFAIGGSFLAYLVHLKNEKKIAREKDRQRSIGKADIGGEFDLVDQDNKKVTSSDLLGQWLLIYFGFTHCPDICPDEIEKMVKVVDIIDKNERMQKVKPVFISVDPERDSPEAVKKYLNEFSDKILGLTGSTEQVAKVCKAYRVYFSAGPKDSDNDYIVDHSIIMYLVNPEGNFVDYYGQSKNAHQIALSIEFNQVRFDDVMKKTWQEKVSEIIFGE